MLTVEGRQQRLAVIGQGYVGLPLSYFASQAGFLVTGIDTNGLRVKQLSEAKSFVPDITPTNLLEMKTRGYKVSSSYSEIADFDIAVITVPTPLEDGQPDLRAVKAAASCVGKFLRRGASVILESTTYPGTTRELVIPVLEEESRLKAGVDFYVGYSPERIDPGNKNWNLANTPKIVSGLEPKSTEKVAEFYRSFVEEIHIVDSLETAELTKLLENTFRHTNIALVNELAQFSNSLGANIWEAISAAETKPFGFMTFYPGPGVGGHCLPIDPTFLSWKAEQVSGGKFRMINSANDVNEGMPRFIVEKLLEHSPNRSAPSSILVVGLSYKENTGDIRESPSLEIIKLLEAAGHRVFGLDPLVPEEEWPKGLGKVDGTFSEEFDLAVIACLHDEIDVTSIIEQCAIVFDTRNSLGNKRGQNVITF